jgi:hypothetical protein
MTKDEFVSLFKSQPYEVQEACVEAFQLPRPQVLTLLTFSAQTGMSPFDPTIVGASYHATVTDISNAVVEVGNVANGKERKQ